MAYRGEDLDLRTPQTWTLPQGELGAGQPLSAASEPYANGARSRVPGYGRANQPILVDEVVLACCNHAFDVAVAHRAGEVRIEHLLHAMTRIEGASNALDARGIRVSGLRRESATIIAGEIPIGLGAGQSRPRRSDDLEALLRAASALGYRRNGPASIDDVLDALFDMPTDLPAIALLARHGGRVARDRSRVRPPREALPPLPLPPLPSLPRPPAGFGETRTGDTTAPSYYTADLARPARTDLVGTATDGIQNARIDQLENALRTLTAELASERGAVSGVVQDLQRTQKAEREDAHRFRGGLYDRLQSLEQTVTAVSGSDRSDQLHDRMKSLEYAVLNARPDGGDAAVLLDRLATIERNLDQRLAELARPWSVLSDRLQALEQTVLDQRGVPGADIGSVHDRIAGLERAFRDTAGEGSRSQAGLADRLKHIERLVDGAQRVDLTPIANRLDIIEEAVLSSDGATASAAIADRLRSLEDQFSAQRTAANQSAQSIANDVRALASALASQAAGNERTQALVSDRVQSLTSGLERQRTDLVGPLNERLDSLAAGIMTRLSGALSPLTDRMTSLERRLDDSAKTAAEAQGIHTAELKEVHEALIKLNTNQHTLAGSIDQWRLDGIGDVSVIAKQLDSIEKSSSKPLAMMEALTTSVDTINRVTVERYHRRNRFWYWLYGTDDWLTASWPSQVASIVSDRAQAKGPVPKVAAQPTPRPGTRA